VMTCAPWTGGRGVVGGADEGEEGFAFAVDFAESGSELVWGHFGSLISCIDHGVTEARRGTWVVVLASLRVLAFSPCSRAPWVITLWVVAGPYQSSRRARLLLSHDQEFVASA